MEPSVPPGHRRLRAHLHQILGPLLVIVVLILIQLAESDIVRFPDPDAIYLTAIVYATFTGGLWSGLASAVITLAYALYFYQLPGPGLRFTHDNAIRIGVLAVATPSLVVMVGLLRRRSARQLERLRESEARTRAIVDGVADGILTFDEKGTIEGLTAGAERIFGRKADSVVGRDLRMLLPTGLPIEDGETSWRGELEALRAGGERFPAEIAVNAVGLPGRTLHVAIVRDVTARKRAEMALAEQAGVLREQAELLDLAHDTIIVRDMGSAITFWNKGAESTYGFAREEAIGRISHEMLQTVFPKPLAEIERELLTDGHWEGELSHCRRDGTRIVVASRWALQKSPAGAPKAILEINNDITERKRAQLALEEQAATLGEQAELLDLAHDTIIVREMEGTITFWNKGAEHMYGYSREEAIGRSSHELLRTVFPEPLEAIVARVLRDGRWEGELSHTRRDGTRVVAASRWALQRRADGSARVLEINNDITKRKRAEQAFERLSRQNELILKSAGEGIYGVDLSGVAMFVNPAAARILGYQVEELIGKPLEEIVHAGSSDGEAAAEGPAQRTLADGNEREIADAMFRRKDGSRIPVECVGAPIREGTRLVGAVVAFRDVTERRRLERMKDEFVSVVSHELRTPLTSLRGSLGLLAGRAAEVPDESRRMIDVAAQSAERLSRLVDDILDIERMESGRLTMDPAPCDGRTLCCQAVEAMMPMAEEAKIRLEVSEGTAPLWADPDRIIQTLTNLISNAIKFSPEGSRVTLSASAADGHALFSVRDHGRGIPPDKIDTIFERFVQLDASDARVKGGTGLGLSICREIVTQHGGRIWAEGASSAGSTFCFTLPLAAKAPQAPSRVEAPADGRACSDKRILVIDDDDVIREVAQMSLETGGCRVLTAASSVEGLDLARSEKPDAILLDVMMPDVDGPTVLQKLRADPATGSIPVIFLTAKIQPAERSRLSDLGVRSIIAKPFDPLHLPGEVARVLGWTA